MRALGGRAPTTCRRSEHGGQVARRRFERMLGDLAHVVDQEHLELTAAGASSVSANRMTRATSTLRPSGVIAHGVYDSLLSKSESHANPPGGSLRPSRAASNLVGLVDFDDQLRISGIPSPKSEPLAIAMSAPGAT